jgi:hypothetical protein
MGPCLSHDCLNKYTRVFCTPQSPFIKGMVDNGTFPSGHLHLLGINGHKHPVYPGAGGLCSPCGLRSKCYFYAWAMLLLWCFSGLHYVVHLWFELCDCLCIPL